MCMSANGHQLQSLRSDPLISIGQLDTEPSNSPSAIYDRSLSRRGPRQWLAAIRPVVLKANSNSWPSAVLANGMLQSNRLPFFMSSVCPHGPLCCRSYSFSWAAMGSESQEGQPACWSSLDAAARARLL